MGDEREGLRPDDLLDYVKELAPAPKRLAVYALGLEARVGQLTQELQAEREAVGRCVKRNVEKARRITELEAALETICNIGETRDVAVARAVLSTRKEKP